MECFSEKSIIYCSDEFIICIHKIYRSTIPGEIEGPVRWRVGKACAKPFECSLPAVPCYRLRIWTRSAVTWPYYSTSSTQLRLQQPYYSTTQIAEKTELIQRKWINKTRLPIWILSFIPKQLKYVFLNYATEHKPYTSFLYELEFNPPSTIVVMHVVVWYTISS